MKIFLKFKHWQIFLIWIITGVLFAITIFTHIWFITLAIYAFLLVGWIYSVGKVTNELNEKNRIENYHEDLWFILFLISVFPFGYFSHTTTPENGFFMFGAMLLEAIPAIKLVNFSARAISQYEKKKSLKFSDYSNEFLLILFLPISIWKIQPKMNDIIKKNKSI